MCGICGKVTFDDSLVQPDLIERMCHTLTHRGPDDLGVHTAPHVGLGQRRLAIIDLSPEAAPPLANEDQSIWVVFNGEIYNFRQLREDLVARGHAFRTSCDTEVIPHLYEEYGTDCLTHMRGMFAFALWDARRDMLFAARDRLGQKPLSYARSGRSLVFGSEIKAITADPSVTVAPDYRALDMYLTYRYVPSPMTAFEGISKLPPGHFLTCGSDGEVRVECYWRPPHVEPAEASAGQIKDELVARLRESVRMRLVSDVPLGAFLSGGIDSGTIVALMAQESGGAVKTFSIGFKEDEFNELPHARMVARRYGTDHHELIVEPHAAEVLPLLVRHYNEPFADSSALPTYYVSQMTRRDVTVALSGDGGDESFLGYGHYRRMLAWGMFDVVPAALRKAMLGSVSSLVDRLPHHNLMARISRGLAMVAGTLPQRHRLARTMIKPQEKTACTTRQFQALAAEGTPHEDRYLALEWDKRMDAGSWLMRHDQGNYLPDCLMVKTDIASMANGLEVRCPLLDHEFVEFAAGIPTRMKRDANGGKAVFRSAVADLLPPEVLTKPKTGFDVPLHKWFGGELARTLRDVLLGPRCRQRGLLDAGFVGKMIDDHQTGRRLWGKRLWTLLMLEMWFQEFID